MSRPIEFGIMTNLHHTTYAEVRSIWQTAEREGLDHAWTPDHLLPAFSDLGGATLEGWTTLTALLFEVPRIRAGVLVSCNPFRPPALLAKMATTLDEITEGRRLEMAIGAGWLEQEFHAYGIELLPLRQRLAAMHEALQVLQSMWTQERTDFEGQYYTIRDAPFAPKPVQRPRPPLWIGGRGKDLTLSAVARYADGWNVVTPPREEYVALLEALERRCTEVDRDPATVRKSLAMRLALDSDPAAARARLSREAEDAGQTLSEVEPLIDVALAGSPADVAEQVAAYVELGVDHIVVLMDPPFHHEKVTGLAREVMPLLRAAGL